MWLWWLGDIRQRKVTPFFISFILICSGLFIDHSFLWYFLSFPEKYVLFYTLETFYFYTWYFLICNFGSFLFWSPVQVPVFLLLQSGPSSNLFLWLCCLIGHPSYSGLALHGLFLISIDKFLGKLEISTIPSSSSSLLQCGL